MRLRVFRIGRSLIEADCFESEWGHDYNVCPVFWTDALDNDFGLGGAGSGAVGGNRFGRVANASASGTDTNRSTNFLDGG